MSNITTFHSKTAIREQACLWVSRMDRGLTAPEKAELIIWLEHKNHRDVLFNMAALWDDICVLNQLNALFPLEKQSSAPKKTFQWLATAASLAAFVLISVLLLMDNSTIPTWLPGAEKSSHYQTMIGQQQRFSLSDGSLIQLNTNSEVAVTYTRDSRRIQLIKGEAQFDVAKDPLRPFTVSAGIKSFTALGTVFNVRKRDDNDIELVVTEGKVLMAAANIPRQQVLESFAHPSVVAKTDVIVYSGEKAIVNNNTPTAVKTLSLDQVQRDLAWQQGMLIFDGEPLASALDDISRYTTKTFTLADPQLAELKVSGYFKAGDIDGLLQSLQSSLNIKTDYQSAQHIVLYANNS